MKTSAIMFVATATCGSMPNSIITGTVTSEVLPVTTLIKLVRKKIEMRINSLPTGTPSSYTRLIVFISGVMVFNLETEEVMDRV